MFLQKILGYKPSNSNVRKLKHGQVSDNGAVSFNLNDIKTSMNREDQRKIHTFIKRETQKA